MTKKILVLLVLNIFFSAYPQERQATILFDDGTAIDGYASIKNNKILFKLELTSEVTEWSYDMAKGLLFYGYGFSGKLLYVKPEKNKDPVLMEVVEEGNVNLYRRTKNDWHGYIFGDGDQILVPFLTLGHNLNLNFTSYKRISSGLDVEVTYYVKRENEDFGTDISFSFKSRALRYFGDCKDLVKKINSKEFKKNHIADLVFFYNQYCGEEDQ